MTHKSTLTMIPAAAMIRHWVMVMRMPAISSALASITPGGKRRMSVLSAALASE